MSCGCGDIRRCGVCFNRWFRSTIESMTQQQLEELGRRLGVFVGTDR